MAFRGVFGDHLVAPAIQLPGLQALTGIGKITQTLTPGSVAANTTAEQSFSVPGVLPGDAIDINPPALTAGVVLSNARVSAANTIQAQFTNSTGGALTPPAGTHVILVVR